MSAHGTPLDHAGARALYERVVDSWLERDAKGTRELLHPHIVYTNSATGSVRGVEESIEAIWAAVDPFAVGRVDLRDLMVDGDTVIVRGVFRSSHTGAFLGVVPTGREVAFAHCDVMQVRDGKIYRWRGWFDRLEILRQLGVQVRVAGQRVRW